MDPALKEAFEKITSDISKVPTKIVYVPVYQAEVITRGDYHVLVFSDLYFTGIYTCDEKGVITNPGERIRKGHISVHENMVCRRHLIGKMRLKEERFFNDGKEPGTYFGCVKPRHLHMYEIPDEHKQYDDDLEQERIYLGFEEYKENIGLEGLADLIEKETHFQGILKDYQSKLILGG